MKRYIMTLVAGMLMMPMAAQETYESAKLAENDLNGTARYVGMGGAMEALGADISTISTNPAGIGMFRKSNANLSMGFVTQQDAPDFGVGKKTYMSFDQVGFVLAMQTNATSYLNFAFNYHKSKNFDYILGAADRLTNASQNKLTYAKALNGLLYRTNTDGSPNFGGSYASCSQLDDIYARNLNYDSGENVWYYEDAQGYNLDRSHTGFIGEYDFNLSGNINNRVYLGMTLGLHDVHYKHYGEYTEHFAGNSPITVADDRRITGAGVDLKFGIIFRPVEESPFRVGLSVATPTWYDLTTSNYTTVTDDGGTAHAGEDYDFNLTMPWKFGVSLGHTIGNNLALGASYEYSDYAGIDNRVKNDNRDWDSYDSESDDIMNRHTEQSLRAVNTLKLGVEYKPVPEMAVRLGYNWVSPMYKKDDFKDGSLDIEGSYYSSATDFTNWQSTNRITCGFGYQCDKNLNLAIAYQYQTRNGEFEPFMSYRDSEFAEWDNVVDPVKVSFKRHQVLLTATYTF
ncbi:MAG: hemin receptor [Prevotella sp.]|nr:hemin receptor [Prevotella sp.]